MFQSKWAKYLFLTMVLLVVSFGIYLYVVTDIDLSREFLTIVGNSMTPTFQDGEEVKYSPSFNKDDIKEGVVVIFSKSDMPNVFVLKRVIGVEGDLIDIIENQLYLNGKMVKSVSYDESISYFIYDYSTYVGEDEVFVIGDNYNSSKDSRQYGCISVDSIKGIVNE